MSATRRTGKVRAPERIRTREEEEDDCAILEGRVPPSVLRQMVAGAAGDSDCRWIAYRNADLGSPLAGHRQFLRVGPRCTYAMPPLAYPADTPFGMGFRYLREGVVDLLKGEVVPFHPYATLQHVRAGLRHAEEGYLRDRGWRQLRDAAPENVPEVCWRAPDALACRLNPDDPHTLYTHNMAMHFQEGEEPEED